MTKRKSLADQVGEQAVTIDGLRTLLSQQQADFAVLERSHEVALASNAQLNENLIGMTAARNEAVADWNDSNAKIIKLEAELKSSKSSYEYSQKRVDAAESEIEQAHATLNTIPEAVPAEFEKEYGKGKHSLSARFMGTLVALMRAV